MTHSQAPDSPKRENLLLNVGLNVVLPTMLLSKGGDWFSLTPAWVLVIALCFPLAYGVYDLIVRRKVNIFSIIGLISVLITGGVGLLNLSRQVYIWKEAGVPALFGLAVWVSMFTQKPLVRTLLYSPEIFDVPMIEASIEENKTRSEFEAAIKVATYWLIGSFALSAVLNYVLAAWIVTVEPSVDQDLFNKQVGKMTGLSYVIIVLPTLSITMVALTKLVKAIERCTGHTMEEVMHPEMRAKVEAKEQAQKEREAGEGASG